MIYALFILLSFMSGNIESTMLPDITPELFPETFYSVVIDTNSLFYTESVHLDSLSGNWSVSPYIDTLKAPVLEAMSIKQKDTLSYIGINFTSPTFDTSHILFIQLDAKSEMHKILASNYLAGFNIRKNTIKFGSSFLHLVPSVYFARLQFQSNPILFITETALSNNHWYTNSKLAYRRRNLQAGFFATGFKKLNHIGPFLGIQTKKIGIDARIPLTNYTYPFIRLRALYKNVKIFAGQQPVYNMNVNTLEKMDIFNLTYSSNNVYISSWYKSLNEEKHMGTSFLLTPMRWFQTGYILQKDTLKTSTSFIVTSRLSLYKGELINSINLTYHNFNSLYYSVEFLLFKNLLLSIKKNEHGDFIGVFVRLIN